MNWRNENRIAQVNKQRRIIRWVVINCDPDPEPHTNVAATPVHIEHNTTMQLAMRVAVSTGAREWADIQMGWRAKRNGTSFTSNQTTGDAIASAATLCTYSAVFLRCHRGSVPVRGLGDLELTSNHQPHWDYWKIFCQDWDYWTITLGDSFLFRRGDRVSTLGLGSATTRRVSQNLNIFIGKPGHFPQDFPGISRLQLKTERYSRILFNTEHSQVNGVRQFVYFSIYSLYHVLVIWTVTKPARLSLWAIFFAPALLCR